MQVTLIILGYYIQLTVFVYSYIANVSTRQHNVQ